MHDLVTWTSEGASSLQMPWQSFEWSFVQGLFPLSSIVSLAFFELSHRFPTQAFVFCRFIQQNTEERRIRTSIE